MKNSIDYSTRGGFDPDFEKRWNELMVNERMTRNLSEFKKRAYALFCEGYRCGFDFGIKTRRESSSQVRS